MLKKIILIENEEQVQCDSLEEVVKLLIDENYYNLSQDEKAKKMKTKALKNCINNKREIVQEIDENILNNLDNYFIIKDEMTYILSLLMTNNLVLLERIDSNIFSDGLNKERFENNYIVINKFAKELLEKHLKKQE